MDLRIIDDSDKLIEYGQHEVAFLSAHDLIYIKYGLRVERRQGRCVICRDCRSFDETTLLSDIQDLDWTDLLISCSMDEKIAIFNSKLLDILNSHAPLKRRYFKNLPALWLTNDIHLAMHERNLVREFGIEEETAITTTDSRFRAIRPRV